jgi:hypothetical protein
MEEYKKYIWKDSREDELKEWENSSVSFTCDLDRIGQKYNCDKCNVQYMSIGNKNVPQEWPVDLNLKITGHNYLQVYSNYFNPVRNESINILEIGMGNYPTNGYSMRAWLEFFTNAKITILDNNACNFRYDFEFDRSRVETHVIDQSSSSDLDSFISSVGDKKFDFIIDDGSHQADHQIISFKKLFPSILKENGTYFIEDIHDKKFVNYLPELYSNLNNGELSGEYRLDNQAEDLGISSINMYRSLICINKGNKITR